MSALYVENCGHCGRFVGTGGDSYTHWGHAGMDEPPDPIILCARCAERDYQEYLAAFLARGLPCFDHRGAWQPSDAWFRARRTVRAIWKHGLAERPVLHERVRYETSGTRQVWFCACGRPEPHPAHDLKESRRLHVPYCHFEKRVGRNFGKFHVQEWCACGWTTGRHHTPRGQYPPLTDYLGQGSLMREHLDAHRPTQAVAA